MKPQTYNDMINRGATPDEAAAAVELFRVLRPGLKLKRENGRIETTHGDKTPLGFYRTVKDLTGHTALKSATWNILTSSQTDAEKIQAIKEIMP